MLLTIYFIANAFAAFLRVSDGPTVSRRLEMLCLINLVPLYVGGRTSYVIDRALGISLDRYLLLHRWISRIYLLYAVGYGISYSVKDARNLSSINIAVSTENRIRILLAKYIKLLSISVSITLLLFLHLRRRFYEAFLFSYAYSGPALLILL